MRGEEWGKDGADDLERTATGNKGTETDEVRTTDRTKPDQIRRKRQTNTPRIANKAKEE